MLIALFLQTVVCLPTITNDRCPWVDTLLNDVKQSERVTRLHGNEEKIPTLAAYSSKNPLTFYDTTYVILSFTKFRFINLDNFP